jgi:hypothetical protein
LYELDEYFRMTKVKNTNYISLLRIKLYAVLKIRSWLLTAKTQNKYTCQKYNSTKSTDQGDDGTIMFSSLLNRATYTITHEYIDIWH